MATRLIFIHGIKQDPDGKDQLTARWRNLLAANATMPGLFEATDSAMVFYADILGAAAIAAGIVGMGPVAEAATSDAAEADFIAAGLREMARSAGATDQEISMAADSQAGTTAMIAQGSAVGRRLVGALAAIEARVPAAGLLGVRVLKEAYLYLTQPALRDAIDQRARDVIAPALAAGDRIVVLSHSLGTVIGFRVLRELAAAPLPAGAAGTPPVPLLVTMGSPLSIAAVRKHVGLPTVRPAIVGRWANFYDKSDLVSLGKGLPAEVFGAGISNDGDVDNDTFNAHGIEGYLIHDHIIAALEQELTAGN